MELQLLCGAAKRDITPDEDLLGKLTGNSQRYFSAVHDRIYVRAVALCDGTSTALIITQELSDALDPEEMILKISRETEIPEENIFYCGTHTHTAPVSVYRLQQPKFAEARKRPQALEAAGTYDAFVKEKTLEAVKDAAASMQPARLFYSEGESCININRNQIYRVRDQAGKIHEIPGLGRDPQAPVDRTLSVLRAENRDGRVIAFLVNYALHNTAMIFNNADGHGGMEISSDIGGNVSQYLEHMYPGSVAEWTSSAAGDVNPYFLNQFYYPDPKDGSQAQLTAATAETAHIILKMLSSQHLADVCKAMEQKEEILLDHGICGAIELSSTPGDRETMQEDGKIRVDHGVDGAPFLIRLHMLRLGELALLGIGGEPYTTLGRCMKEAAPAKHTILITHDANQIYHTTYLYDDEMIKRIKNAEYQSFDMAGPGTNFRYREGTLKGSLIGHTHSMYEQLFCRK